MLAIAVQCCHRSCLTVYCSGCRLIVMGRILEAASACCRRLHFPPSLSLLLLSSWRVPSLSPLLLLSSLTADTAPQQQHCSSASQQRAQAQSESSLGSAARAPKPAG